MERMDPRLAAHMELYFGKPIDYIEFDETLPPRLSGAHIYYKDGTAEFVSPHEEEPG